MTKLICTLGKRVLILNGIEYEIPHEVAKWIVHNTNIKVSYSF